ncbi:hypothetical protein DERF_008833 [Dermatophagoides farinae]|uniref:Uncharacterized protein n=1 Tax=Dermatophagoides farinae TaxID=6954 RepID=A0A922I338_DERFA|nr:hypothetical protein DERF_008833 [Dermatophagoides farinae]
MNTRSKLLISGEMESKIRNQTLIIIHKGYAQTNDKVVFSLISFCLRVDSGNDDDDDDGGGGGNDDQDQ